MQRLFFRFSLTTLPSKLFFIYFLAALIVMSSNIFLFPHSVPHGMCLEFFVLLAFQKRYVLCCHRKYDFISVNIKKNYFNIAFYKNLWKQMPSVNNLRLNRSIETTKRHFKLIIGLREIKRKLRYKYKKNVSTFQCY